MLEKASNVIVIASIAIRKSHKSTFYWCCFV